MQQELQREALELAALLGYGVRWGTIPTQGMLKLQILVDTPEVDEEDEDVEPIQFDNWLSVFRGLNAAARAKHLLN